MQLKMQKVRRKKHILNTKASPFYHKKIKSKQRMITFQSSITLYNFCFNKFLVNKRFV